MLTCPKGLLNGPCGGVREGGICERGEGICPWYKMAMDDDPKLVEFRLDSLFKVRDYDPKPKPPLTGLMLKLREHKRALVVEFTPRIKSLKGVTVCEGLVDAISVTDNPMASIAPSPIAFIARAKENVNCDFILHLSCRGKDRDSLISVMMGAWMVGARYILAVTGDLSQTPSFFDLDSTRLIYLARLVSDRGLDYMGRELREKPSFHVGGALNPNVKPIKVELTRALRKVRAGAEFLVLQPVYDASQVKDLAKGLRRLSVNVPLIVGLAVASSPFLLRELKKASVRVPESLYNRVLRAYKAEGERGAVEEGLKDVLKLMEDLSALEGSGIGGFYVTTLGKLKYLPYILKEVKGVLK